MYGKDNWKGKEVEGRYSDIMTLFIRNGALPKEWNKYPHIYFTTEYIENRIANNKWEDIVTILDTSIIPITIEATEKTFDNIPIFLFNRVHIIYRIPNQHVEKLKKTDTVSIDAGWYRVKQITKCHLMDITPDDYKYDELL
jgi:hypothetical protein